MKRSALPTHGGQGDGEQGEGGGKDNMTETIGIQVKKKSSTCTVNKFSEKDTKQIKKRTKKLPKGIKKLPKKFKELHSPIKRAIQRYKQYRGIQKIQKRTYKRDRKSRQ